MSRLKGCIVLKGVMRNTSPFVIGRGEGNFVDIEIVKDGSGNPYIPATSFTGAVKHYLMNHFDIPCEMQDGWEVFWGSGDRQSSFVVNDLCLVENNVFNSLEPVISVRDGIAVDHDKGIALEKAKYDYELVNQDVCFNLEAEIILREQYPEEHFIVILKTILEELKAGNIYLGAFINKGLGRFKLEKCDVYKFCFPKDGTQYFHFLEDGSLTDANRLDMQGIAVLAKKKAKDLNIIIDCSIKSSLIIGSYNVLPNLPDKANIRYADIPVISGSSLKGALRNRGFKIVKTLLDSCDLNKEVQEKLDNLFGYVKKEKEKDSASLKSRVVVEEIKLADVEEIEHTRIKIDRFTGGVMEGALFNSKPVWHKGENIKVCIKVRNALTWEVGLFLLIIKDLCNEDLPIGGEKSIGRGLLRYNKTEICYGNEMYVIEREREPKNLDELESYVGCFLRELGV